MGGGLGYWQPPDRSKLHKALLGGSTGLPVGGDGGNRI
jgi:hypothetical protein